MLSRDFCHLLITFANSLDPDQDQLNVGPQSGYNQLDTLKVFLIFFKNHYEKKDQQTTKYGENLPSLQELIGLLVFFS